MRPPSQSELQPDSPEEILHLVKCYICQFHEDNEEEKIGWRQEGERARARKNMVSFWQCNEDSFGSWTVMRKLANSDCWCFQSREERGEGEQNLPQALWNPSSSLSRPVTCTGFHAFVFSRVWTWAWLLELLSESRFQGSVLSWNNKDMASLVKPNSNRYFLTCVSLCQATGSRNCVV